MTLHLHHPVSDDTEAREREWVTSETGKAFDAYETSLVNYWLNGRLDFLSQNVVARAAFLRLVRGW